MEFALVTPILMGVALAVLQVALILHVRTTLTAAAAEGARASALVGADHLVGERRVRDVLATTIGSTLVREVTVWRERRAGAVVAAVGIDAVLPVVGLIGPTTLHVDGHAVEEHS